MILNWTSVLVEGYRHGCGIDFIDWSVSYSTTMGGHMPPFSLLVIDLSLVDLLRHRRSHSQHVVSVGKLVTCRQPATHQIEGFNDHGSIQKNVIGWTLSRHSKQANRLFHHLFSQLVTMWSFPLLASHAGHNETHPQLPSGPVILWLAEMNQIRHGSVRHSFSW